MTLALAILSVLSVSPRPLAARTIAALVPQFAPAPALPTDVEAAATQVEAECELLAAQGDVIFQASRNFGRLWSITTIGQARLRE